MQYDDFGLVHQRPVVFLRKGSWDAERIFSNCISPLDPFKQPREPSWQNVSRPRRFLLFMLRDGQERYWLYCAVVLSVLEGRIEGIVDCGGVDE